MLGAARLEGLRSRSQRIFHYLRYRVFVNSVLLAIGGFEPIAELLRAFARIAPDATSGNILTSDNSCIVDDVLPRRNSLS